MTLSSTWGRVERQAGCGVHGLAGWVHGVREVAGAGARAWGCGMRLERRGSHLRADVLEQVLNVELDEGVA